MPWQPPAGRELRTGKVNELSHRPPGGRAEFWNLEADWDAGCVPSSEQREDRGGGLSESRSEGDGHRAQLLWDWAFQGLRVRGSEPARPQSHGL